MLQGEQQGNNGQRQPGTTGRPGQILAQIKLDRQRSGN
jgi:hypothetical protein